MSHDLDQTESDQLAKNICGLLEDQRKRIRRTMSDVDSQSRTSVGVQAFRVERRSAIQLLNDWIGAEDREEFENLPAKVLNQHPSLLAMNYLYRGFAKEEVENHASFLEAIIQRVRFGPIEFNGTRIKHARRVILRTFADAAEEPNAEEGLNILIDEYGFEINVLFSHLQYLTDKNLLREVNLEYLVTQAGHEELKLMENEAPESLEQKRFRVLKTLYDMAPNDKHGMVIVADLAKALGMNYHEANRILLYWEEKGMVNSPADEAVALTASAIDELEDKINHPSKSTQHFPSTINITDNSINIQGNVTGPVQGGQNNTQIIINEESISEILPKLADFIQTVRSADFADRDDAIRDMEAVKALAQRELNAGVWERIQAKLTSAETTMKVAGFVYKTHPYWPAIAEFFHRHWR